MYAIRQIMMLSFVVLMSTAGGGLGAPLGTSLTYQGRLTQNGSPMSGPADLAFSLWDDAGSGIPPAGGNQIGSTQTVLGVPVVAGLFTVELDGGGEFGANAFNGDARWLQIAVNGTTLAPRQPLTAAPYALRALSVASGGATHWLNNGNDVYLLAGNAGIGVDTPTATLHLNRPYADTAIRFQTVRFQEGPPLSTEASAGAASVGGAGQPWDSPDAARISDDVWATVTLGAAPGDPDPSVSTALDLTGFKFAIPAQAVIVGITARIEAESACSCSDCDVCRVNGVVELLGGPGPSNQTPFVFPGAEAMVLAGGTFDTWGLEWTPAEVNASSFGVRLAAELTLLKTAFCIPGFGCAYESCDCTGQGSVGIDATSITVFYYDAAVSSTPVDWTLGIPEARSALQISRSADLSAPVVHIDPAGGVGINTTDPMHFTLAVNGAAAKPGGGSWAALSDARLKQSVQPMAGTLDRLLALHGYEFEYTDEAVDTGFGLPGKQIGLLAQEVECVFPDWIGRDPSGYLHVTERATTALMVEALRDLRQEKDAEIADLKQRLARVESLLEQRK